MMHTQTGSANNKIKGYIYCFSNVSMPGILKCGMTERTPQERLYEANSSDTWRPPTPFVIEFAKFVCNPREKEHFLHYSMNEYRIHARREYFRVDIASVKALFNMIEGEMWIAPIIDMPDYTCPDYNIRIPRVPKSVPIFTPTNISLAPGSSSLQDELQFFAYTENE